MRKLLAYALAALVAGTALASGPWSEDVSEWPGSWDSIWPAGSGSSGGPTYYGPVYTGGVYGAGGQIHGMAAAGPTQALLVTDNTFHAVTTDGGATWETMVGGIATDEAAANKHENDAAYVENSAFTGYATAGAQGLLVKSGTTSSGLWQNLTPISEDYWFFDDLGWAERKVAIPFGAVDAVGRCLIAGAGRIRVRAENNYANSWYPGGLDQATGVGSDPPKGNHSLWRMYWNDTNGEEVRPFPGIGDIGAIYSLDAEIVSGDTLVAIASTDGIFLWDSASQDTTDLTGYGVGYPGGTESFAFTYDAGGSSTGQMCYSIELTERGTVYAGIRDHASAWGAESGAYRMHDATSPTAWRWVGDDTSVSPLNTSIFDYGTGGAHGAHVAVLEGATSDPDTVYMAYDDAHYSNSRRLGLVRANAPYDDATHYDQTWEAMFWVWGVWNNPTDRNLYDSPGGLDMWGWDTGMPSTTVQPVVIPGGTVYYNPHTSLWRSDDYGESWASAYTDSITGGYYASRGFHQTGVQYDSLEMLPSGELVFSLVDQGVIESNADRTGFRTVTPPTEANSTHNLGFTWAVGAGENQVVEDWQATSRPAVISILGRVMDFADPGRVIVYHDDNDDGEMTWYSEPSLEWGVTNDTNEHGPTCIEWDGHALYTAGRLYDGEVTEWGTRDGAFVYYQTFDGSSWSEPVTWMEGDLSGYAQGGADVGTPRGLVVSGGRLWLAMAADGSGDGGIFYRAPEDAEWTQVISSTTTPDDYDITSITAYGDELYATTRGDRARGEATILHCPDALNSPSSWTKLANNSSADVPLSIGDNITGEEYYGSTVLAQARRYSIDCITVDHKGWVWYGGNGYSGNPYHKVAGLYYYDGSSFTDISDVADASFVGDGYLSRSILIDEDSDDLWFGQACGMSRVDLTGIPGWSDEPTVGIPAPTGTGGPPGWGGGPMFAWARDSHDQVTDLPADTDVIDAATASFGGVALSSDGEILLWGDDSVGGIAESKNLPSTNSGYLDVSAGNTHMCRLRGDGGIECWGDDDVGQSSPPAIGTYEQIESSLDANLAIEDDGSLSYWGLASHGQQTVPSGTNYTDIATGGYHCLALDDTGAISAWGRDDHNQVTNAPTGTGYIDIACGTTFSVAIASDGSLEAWGQDDQNQITDLPAGTGFTHVWAGRDLGIAVNEDGTMSSWGNNLYNIITNTPSTAVWKYAFTEGRWAVAIEE